MLVLQGITRKGEQNKDRTLLELGSRGGAQKICILSNLHLTNFFDLSNIRFESGGPVKMFGASRCLRNGLFQFEGHPALGADLPISCDSSIQLAIQVKGFSQFHRGRNFLVRTGDELHTFCVAGQNPGG